MDGDTMRGRGVLKLFLKLPSYRKRLEAPISWNGKKGGRAKVV